MMKLALLAVLATSMLTAQAAENYGSVTFDSSVPKNQIEAMKADIKYLYKNDITVQDAEFASASKLGLLSGPVMHNWLVNRVKYIFGEKYDSNANLIKNKKFVFPNTPVPKLDTPEGSAELAEENGNSGGEEGVKIVMINLGSALYLSGKMGMETKIGVVQNLLGLKPAKRQLLLGVKHDGRPLYATSARVGIIQVGEGLFSEKHRVNDVLLSPAASIQRLATYFHEARHSDGNGHSTAFAHNYCPDTHPYGGFAGCERSSNGPYSMGAMANRTLLKNCTSCSDRDKIALATLVLDSFSRVLSGANAALRLEQYKQVIAKYQTLLKTYEGMYLTIPANRIAELNLEIGKVKKMLNLLNGHAEKLKKELNFVPVPMDDTPEGYFENVPLQSSMNSMAGK